MQTLTAQALYDWREETSAISGTDLHNLFRLICDGEPSPAGDTPISWPLLLLLAARGNTDAEAACEGLGI